MEGVRMGNRRSTDSFKYWMPIILSLVTTILSLGVVYGRLGGRLDLIEYRLGQIERIVTKP